MNGDFFIPTFFMPDKVAQYPLVSIDVQVERALPGTRAVMLFSCHFFAR
jgi:hypothetical protein